MPEIKPDNNMFYFHEANNDQGANNEFFRLKIERAPLTDLEIKKKPVEASEALKTDIFHKDPALLFAKPASKISQIKPKVIKKQPVPSQKVPQEKVLAGLWNRTRAKTEKKHEKKSFDFLNILKYAQITFFKSLLRYAATTTAIFVIGLVLLNFSAYTIVAKSWINKTFSESKADILNVQPKEKRKVEKPLSLAVIQNPDKLKEDIPALNLEPGYPDYRLIIPKINLNVPIVKTDAVNLHQKNWDALEKQILSDLQNGVVHYPGTAMPGNTGNTVITGHSSYWPWDPGRYKTVFAPLHDVEVGDKMYIWNGQKKISYEVIERKVVSPETIEVMKQTDDKRATFVTCTPIGTTLKRLIIVAKVI